MKILGVDFTVERVKNLTNHENNILYGEYSDIERKLYLNDDIDDDFRLMSTLIHEVLHGIEVGLGLTCFSDEHGHAELDRLAYGLTRFITENDLLDVNALLHL